MRALYGIVFVLGLAVGLAACGPDEPDPGSGGPDAGQQDPSSCGPESCDGCCTESGDCVDEIWDRQCGSGGTLCVDCSDDGQACSDVGQCQERECDETTCPDGCCLDDECVDGDDADGCGQGGLQCQTCDTDAGQLCDGTQCRAPCGPSNCSGCCADEFTCVVDPDDEACGSGGESCEDCGDEGFCDFEGQCRDDTCENTCDGCCTDAGDCIERDDQEDFQCGLQGNPCENCESLGDAESAYVCADPGVCISDTCAGGCGGGCCDPSEDEPCQPGTEPAACGGGGDACVSCASFEICSNDDRECRLDPESLWDVVILHAEMPDTDEDGSGWGPLGGQPDPYVRMTLGYDSENELEAQTESVDDATFVEYNEVIFEEVRAADLMEPHLVLFEWVNDNGFHWPDRVMSLEQPIIIPEHLFGVETNLVWEQSDEYEDAENSPLEFVVTFDLVPSGEADDLEVGTATRTVSDTPLRMCRGDNAAVLATDLPTPR